MSLGMFEREIGGPLSRPVPLDDSVRYGDWFQQRAVPQVENRVVEQVESHTGRFSLGLADGEEVAADRVVVAAGIGPFHAARPSSPSSRPGSRPTPPSTVTSACSAGAGSSSSAAAHSALESAALAREAGADVEVVVRRDRLTWLTGARTRRLLGAPTPIFTRDRRRPGRDEPDRLRARSLPALPASRPGSHGASRHPSGGGAASGATRRRLHLVGDVRRDRGCRRRCGAGDHERRPHADRRSRPVRHRVRSRCPALPVPVAGPCLPHRLRERLSGARAGSGELCHGAALRRCPRGMGASVRSMRSRVGHVVRLPPDRRPDRNRAQT